MRRKLLTDMRVLVDRAEALGLDANAVRALRGQDEWDDLDVPERVRRGDALWAFALATCPDPLAFPVALARQYAPDDLGALGLAMHTADTVGAAIHRLVRYHELFLPAPMWRLEPDHDGLRVVCVWAPPLRPVHVAASVEFLLVLLVHLCRAISGEPVPVRQIAFAHAARGPAGALTDVFGREPSFAAGWTGLVLPAEALERPLLAPDPTVSVFLLGELDTLVARTGQPDADLLRERLRTTIRAHLPDGPPPMPAVARKLGMSERTLRRRLAAIDTTYEAMIDATREQLARELVRGTDHSLAEVSWLLGFSEPSAFHRAFKRWTGETPARFRDGV